MNELQETPANPDHSHQWRFECDCGYCVDQVCWICLAPRSFPAPPTEIEEFVSL